MCLCKLKKKTKKKNKLLILSINKIEQNYNTFRVFSCMYLPNPSTCTGCNTKSILKWSKAGLNSDYSYSEPGYQIKAKETSLFYYIPIAWRKTDGFIPFSRTFNK